VQVRHTPLVVISQEHMPMVRLQQQTIMPFIIMQQVHMPPARAEHRFCTMVQAMGSSHTQVIFMPPLHFSILKVQRGTIIQFMDDGIVGMVAPEDIPIPEPGIPIPIRSIVLWAIF
jgi:hypothetical protein